MREYKAPNEAIGASDVIIAYVFARLIMGEGRKSQPRKRPTRPIGEVSSAAPVKLNDEPVFQDGMWFIPNPLSSRLYQKSALGQPVEDGILLTVEEVMFCHWHRHVPLPKNWVEQQMAKDPDFAYRVVAFDVVRSGGEKVVLQEGKWLRWARDSHPASGDPEAEIRWARTSHTLDWNEIMQWVNDVNARGLIAELAIVDEEMDVTMYRISFADPKGDLIPAKPEDFVNADFSNWPSQSIGFEHLSQRFLRQDEMDWVEKKNCSVTSLFDELNSRGLLMRPGFKYGCRWRIYSTPVDVKHAPWLLQMEDDAASNWEGICLSVRLAEGVNKSWLVALDRGVWSFLKFRRHLPGR